MKRSLPRKLLLAVLLSAAVLAQAQNQGPPNGGQRPPGNRSQMNDAGGGADCRRGPPMEELASALGLQASQREPLANLLKQRHEAMRRSHDEAGKKADAIAAQSNAQIAKLLSPAQMGKFQEWEKTHRPPPPPREGQGMGGGQGRGGPPQQGGGGERRGPPQQGGGGENRGGPQQHGEMRCPPPPRDDGPPPEDDRRGGQP